jgi:polypeptide N-acetylgalactosaminyltransferase
VNPQANQHFALSWQRDIRLKFGELCWDVSESGKAQILLFGCHGMQGNQFWRYHPDTNEIVLVNSKRCLDVDFNTKTVFVNPCDKSPTQKWEFGQVNKTAIDNWLRAGSKIIT